MQVIGLTGSIASGKSTVRMMCEHMGIPTIDADQIVHGLLSPSGTALQPVLSAFPEAATKMGIDRQRLGEIVFSDQKKLKELEQIIHPEVKKQVDLWIRKQRRLGIKRVVVEVPLLFESGMYRHYARIIMTAASLPCIRHRALARKGMNEKKLRSILARQWPQVRKMAYANVCVYTGLGRAESYKKLQQYLKG